MPENLEQIRQEAADAVRELCTAAKLCAGRIMVIGCSSSEIGGQRIGSDSRPEVGETVFNAVYEVLSDQGIYLAAQCCEHLNRALVIERGALPQAQPVNVVPQPKAGGAFACAAYRGLQDPIVIEEIKADAGLDIGGTLIGMHVKSVVVPVRLSVARVGQAPVTAARSRPKYIGGQGAVYDPALM